MIHEMKLKNEPFVKIKSGAKTIEMRLFDEKRSHLNVNDEIAFTNELTQEKIKCNILALLRFPSFAELYEHCDKSSLGYEKDQTPNPDDMLKYYSKEQIEKYGVVGIMVRVSK